MILNALLAKILIGVLYVGIIIFFAWVWKKFKKKPVAGGTLGFFLGTIPIIMLVVFPKKIQVVNGVKTYTTYWAYGSPTYTCQNSNTIKITSTNLETIIINDYNRTIEIEEIIYGNPLIEPQTTILKYGSGVILDKKISYFFDEKIPESIDVEYGKYAIEYWLREKE